MSTRVVCGYCGNGFKKVIIQEGFNQCGLCFRGIYPVRLPDKMFKKGFAAANTLGSTVTPVIDEVAEIKPEVWDGMKAALENMVKKKLRASVLKKRFPALGVRAGYWPCLKAPFFQVTLIFWQIDLWFGLPSYQNATEKTEVFK